MAMRTIEPSTKGSEGRGSVDVGFEFFLLLGTSEDASLGRGLLEAWGFGMAAFPLGVAIPASSGSPSLPLPTSRSPGATAPSSRAN